MTTEMTEKRPALLAERPHWPAFQITLQPEQRRIGLSALRLILLTLTGAMPVLAIPAYVFGLASIHDVGLFALVPLTAVTALLAMYGSAEARWAMRGLVAGLLAVAANDALRFPFVFAGIWPDFIPRLGGWITGEGGVDYFMGYLWRYAGDGGGMGMVFFLGCAVFGVRAGTRMGRYPVALGIAYGVFVWSGLIGTVTVLEHGSSMLFPLSWTSGILSLVGHLIYGSVLGLVLRRVLWAPTLVVQRTEVPVEFGRTVEMTATAPAKPARPGPVWPTQRPRTPVAAVTPVAAQTAPAQTSPAQTVPVEAAQSEVVASEPVTAEVCTDEPAVSFGHAEAVALSAATTPDAIPMRIVPLQKKISSRSSRELNSVRRRRSR